MANSCILDDDCSIYEHAHLMNIFFDLHDGEHFYLCLYGNELLSLFSCIFNLRIVMNNLGCLINDCDYGCGHDHNPKQAIHANANLHHAK